MKTYIHLNLHSLILGTILVSSNLPALACPERNVGRMDFNKGTKKEVLQTSDGKKYSCWTDIHSQPVRFKRATYSVVIRCHKTLNIYSYLDGIEEVVIDKNGRKELYKAEFLGDKYKCSSKGETMIKSWIYRRGKDLIKQTGYYYTPYKL